MERITDSRRFGDLRLLNQKDSAEVRKRQQQAAMNMSIPYRSREDRPLSNAPLQSQFPTSPAAQSQPTTLSSDFDRATASRSQEVGQEHYQLPRQKAGGSHSLVRTAARNRYSSASFSAGPKASIARSSTTPAVPKRSLSENSENPNGLDYSTRKIRTRALSLSDITRRLENLTGQTGLYDHIKRISVKSHISPVFRSFRVSNRGSRRPSADSNGLRASTFDSYSASSGRSALPYKADLDYEQRYHRPQEHDITHLRSTGRYAVAALMTAKAKSMGDADAQNHLLTVVNQDPEGFRREIDGADDFGITALHLSVAYGYPSVSRYLIMSGANPFATTVQNSSVCRFARSAQDLAADTGIYHRILNCRQWVCAGLAPPLAEGKSWGPEEKRSWRPAPKRARTSERESALFTVNETMNEEAVNQAANRSQRSSTIADRLTELPPLITGSDFDSGQNGFIPGIEQRMSAFSASPLSARHCLRDHGMISNLLTPTSFSPNVADWSHQTIVGEPQDSVDAAGMYRKSQLVHTGYYAYEPLPNLDNFDTAELSSYFADPLAFTGQHQQTAIPAGNIQEIDASWLWPSHSFNGALQPISEPIGLPYVQAAASGLHHHSSAPLSDYQQLQHQPLLPQYPTPPLDALSMYEDQSWQPDWDVSQATALALTDTSSYWFASDEPPDLTSMWAHEPYEHP